LLELLRMNHLSPIHHGNKGLPRTRATSTISHVVSNQVSEFLNK
jgi:hypothetical protein